MKIIDILNEGRPGRQQVRIMYHGTSSVYLPSIKKFGLLPNTSNKGFGNDDYAYETYGGVYLTADRGTAVEAAHDVASLTRGEPVVITVQYVLGSGGLDEDEITIDIINMYDNSNNLLYKFLHQIQASDIGQKLPQQDHKIFTYLYKVIRALKKHYGAKAEEDILANRQFRQLIKKIIEKTKKYHVGSYGNVRVTRPIGFKGKTRIIGIESIPDMFS